MKRIGNVIAVGILCGSALGVNRAADHIVAQRYLQYDMYRIFALDLQSYLNRWVIMAVAAAVSLYAVWLAGGFVGRVIWRRFLSRHIELRVKGGATLGRRFRASVVAAAFFLLSGSLFNYLYGEYRYSPASLAGDLVILLAALVLGVWLGRDAGKRWLYRLWSPVWGTVMRRVALLFALFLLLLNVLLFVDRIFFPPKGPNVILICIDSLRADHLSCYGYERETSPNIDRFSEDAVLYESAFSQCSWTNPSIASLFTSHYPSTHGVTAFWGGKANTLRKRMVLLAEVMKDSGYATGAFVANHLLQERLNFTQGFDTFNQINAEYKPRAEDVNREALEWISAREGEPFFLYIHYMDVHGPYRPPPPYDSLFRSATKREMSEAEYIKMSQYLLEDDIRELNHYIDRYDGEISYADHYVGKLLEWLKERDLYDNSIIIMTSDHGEEFFDHGWCGHGLTLYNELIRVPLIIRFPGAGGAGGVRKMRAQLVDVGPTVLEFLGTGFPYGVEGESLLARGRKDGGSTEERTVFSEEHEWQTKWDSPPKVAR